MTCKDCLHWKACKDSAYEYYGEDAASAYDDDSCCKEFAEICENFADKSEWLHLLGKDYKTAYYPVGYGDDAKVMEEPIYGLIIDNGKQYVIDEYKDLCKIGEEVFLVKEDAEKAVERRKKIND